MRWRFVKGEGEREGRRFCSGERKDRGSCFGRGECCLPGSGVVVFGEDCSVGSVLTLLSSMFVSAMGVSVLLSAPLAGVVSATLVVCASALSLSCLCLGQYMRRPSKLDDLTYPCLLEGPTSQDR